VCLDYSDSMGFKEGERLRKIIRKIEKEGDIDIEAKIKTEMFRGRERERARERERGREREREQRVLETQITRK